MENETEVTNQEDLQQTELEALVARAKVLGIPHHPSIGLEKLKAKVNAKISDEEDLPVEAPVTSPKAESKGEKSQRLRKEATRLIRVRVACMNPNKKAYKGDSYGVSNKFIGTIRKFVPFDIETHVPKAIFDHMKERKYASFFSVKGANGTDVRKSRLVNELSVEVLPPLTGKEWDELKAQQAAAKSI